MRYCNILARVPVCRADAPERKKLAAIWRQRFRDRRSRSSKSSFQPKKQKKTVIHPAGSKQVSAGKIHRRKDCISVIFSIRNLCFPAHAPDRGYRIETIANKIALTAPVSGFPPEKQAAGGAPMC
jgi:hypothetical protein